MKIKNIYERPRLDKLIATITEYPLLIVTAGAGYGKTTAAKEYLRTAQIPFGWIALTNADENVFWEKFCKAIEPLSGQAAEKLRFIGVPLGDWLITRVIQTLHIYCQQTFILCIDDYYRLGKESSIHRLIELLILEEIPNLHLLLLSRIVSPLPIATFFSKKLCREIKDEDLCFTPTEIEGYLAMRGLRLFPKAVQELYHISKGWISAIYLLCEGIRAGSPIESYQNIDRLFDENLLQTMAAIDKELLYRLAPFDSFEMEMAVQALGMERIKPLITYLLNENAFLTADEHGAFHFHPLFRRYLLSHCPEDTFQKSVYRRAALWYLNRSNYQRYPFIVKLFEQAGCIDELLYLLNKPEAQRVIMACYDYEGIFNIVSHFPDDWCFRYPFPYLQLIFKMILSGESRYVAKGKSLLLQMEEYFTHHPYPNKEIIQGELIIISRVTGFGHISSKTEPLEEAAQLLRGRPSEIIRAYDPFTFGLPMLLYSEYMEAGTLNAAVSRCQHNPYELVTDGFGRGSERLVLAEAALLRCEMREARIYAIQALSEAAVKKQYFISICGYFVLIRRALFLGNFEEAQHNKDAMYSLLSSYRLMKLPLGISNILREALILVECFYSAAVMQVDKIPADFLDYTHHILMVAGLGIPQVFMAKAMYIMGNLMEVERICLELDRIPDICQCAKISQLIYLALAKESLYGRGKGLDQFKMAVQEAEADGVVLPFAECPAVLPLLTSLQRSGRLNQKFISRLIDLCTTYAQAVPQITKEKMPVLTNREKEILHLIAIGKTRKNIAAELCIQEDTVKKHLNNIYRKVGAKNKIEAVRNAEMYGLL